MPIKCCLKCTDKRHLGCHSTCKDYKEEAAIERARKHALAKEKNEDYLFWRQRANAKSKISRTKRK